MSEYINIDDVKYSFQDLWDSTEPELSYGTLYDDNQDNLENLAGFIIKSSYRDVDLKYSEICTFKGYIDIFENVGFHVFNDISPREQKYFCDRISLYGESNRATSEVELFVNFLFYQIEG